MSTRQTRQDRQDTEFGNLLKRLADWKIPTTALDRVHDLSRASLNEVKALTEYEDGKVSRLLTVIAFLSAVVAAVFTRFAGDYVVPALLKPVCSISWWLPMTTYVSFLVYVILVTYSVWSVIGAIRPKFVIPATWTDSGGKGRPSSMVFYKGILDAPALEWVRAFEDQTGDKADDLKATYAKNYIAESYLVAQKVADKLSALRTGIGALRIALLFLFLFFIAYASTIFSLDPTRGATPLSPASAEKR